MHRSICAAVAAVAASLAVPTLAAADTYCVNASPCAGGVQPGVQAALDAAKSHPGNDVVKVGASSSFASARTGKLRGRVRLSARAGLNSVRFAGRVSRRKTLRPGVYRLSVRAADAAGNRSAAKGTRFTLLPRR